MAALIRSACMQGYVPLARSAGLDPYRLLSEAGIHRAWLDQPDVKFSVAAFRTLLERTAAAAGWPDIGLRMAATRNLSGLGPLALLVREQPTIRAAIETMADHIRRHTETLHLHFEPEGDRTLLMLGTAAASRRPPNIMVELSVGALYRYVSQLPPDHPRPMAACFIHPCATEVASYRAFFGAPVQFGADFDGLVYATATLDRPLVADPMLARYARRMVDQMPAPQEGRLADEVKALIAASLHQGTASLQHVCDQMGLHERTLRRRLQREGMSFELILNGVREDLAAGYVASSGRTFTEIATLLGFSGGSRFAHWFRQRFGCSASTWRARQADPAGPGAGQFEAPSGHTADLI